MSVRDWLRRRPALAPRIVLGASIGLAAVLASAAAAQAAETRCGWFDNPSPANASLYDKDGEWIVAVQGGFQAEGDWPPPFRDGDWVRYGPASYGYGCACFRVEVDAAARTVVAILSAGARPLAACRTDPAVAGIEEELR